MTAPTFTIVIPSFNRPGRLARCLGAIAGLTYPRDRFSVVVVDDGSPEPLAPVVADFENRLDIRCERQSNRGPAAARNAGLELAESDWVAFTDDDCRPAPEWLSRLADEAVQAPAAALGGPVVNALTGNPFAGASQLLVDYVVSYHRERSAPFYLTSNNLAFPREALRRVGAFDLSFPLAAGEDRELCIRWQRHGAELRFVEGAVVWHEHDLTARGFWRQHFNYGRGAFQFHRSTPVPMPAEPWAFYANLLLHPVRTRAGFGKLSGAALMLLSQIANTAGYCRERWRYSCR